MLERMLERGVKNSIENSKATLYSSNIADLLREVNLH